jgi:hypothetical protein
MFKLCFALILIFSFTFTINIKTIYGQILTIPNFDVREKFSSCYNHGYSSNYRDLDNCYTNFSIQFTLHLADKVCITKDTKDNRIVSPMNINSCMRYQDTVLDCRNLGEFFVDEEKTINFLNEAIV